MEVLCDRPDPGTTALYMEWWDANNCVRGSPLIQLTYEVTCLIDSLRPRLNICHFTDDRFKCIFLNENVLISIKISLKFIPMSPINNIPTLVHIMAWHQLVDTYMLLGLNELIKDQNIVNGGRHILNRKLYWKKCYKSNHQGTQHIGWQKIIRKKDFSP